MVVKKYSVGLRCASYLVSFAVVVCSFFAVLYFSDRSIPLRTGAVLTDAPAPVALLPTVVIDAGHGGEDGGAVSADGVAEKTLNLSVALQLGDMLSASGVEVIYTRTEDDGLYTGATQGHRKMTDLKNRLAIASAHPDAVLVSIHMNTFSQAQYRGMQVFYSPNNEESERLAELIRQKNSTYLQKDNTRSIKCADDSIYLMRRCTQTGVLIECGFLSNVEEARRLRDPVYREKMAAVICAAILEFLSVQ
ncbi:MAG: N-acetylmuramoyl-L-alanine amidase [Clostridia bacterium]|nr:N-acetylmuramoyl-L-alanine amidase [Clostridia bacterium]